MLTYTAAERKTINDAWFILERLVESDNDMENCLNESYKVEYKWRKDKEHCRILILREVYNYNKIPKYSIFSFSKGIRDCIVMANSLFCDKSKNIKIKEFRKLAKLAIEAQRNYMERRYVTSSN